GEPAIAGSQRARERRAAPHARVRTALQAETARQPDRAQLLREALDPAAHQREIPVDPDVGAARHELTVEQRVDDDEELAVLRAARIEQLGAAGAAAPPVHEPPGGAAGGGAH